MRRDDFLAAVGNPADTLRSAEELEAKALEIWRSARGEFYTAAGKPRAKPPSAAAKQAEAEVGRLREEARRLRGWATEQQNAIRHPWSHILPSDLRRFGLNETAGKVEALHQQYLAASEAA